MKGSSFLFDQIRASLRADWWLLSPASPGSPTHKTKGAMLLTIYPALTAVLCHRSEDSSRALAASPKACEQAAGRAAWVERG